ncbi:MAG TPA: 2-C-methyl-D-erythritol 2,4-cyclodiphosphate synthase [Bacteroidales bacterium]|nr:MAG: 2-C-methyl-D-erythritol 2,4-cyclodiphosphate synthase [Bacteroidetes bacterium GWF2_33_38]OFY89020.1 MAG: 2-C-methyl-D-erythritol 2,4-cyclodiphosphate synthase [Bacteroidetes bacterium RIFOXYA2_FULL_33_7]HBF88461.1 2-C-methyl-D-erythritol 2,4-cyclodiphosphate synthase [Bacteroidales bacterium]
MKIRVGFGYDVHQIKAGEELVLGGIRIVHEKGTVGHSDGDVLIHAICDALFGAANMRDIGFHFPDNDKSLKGIDSKILLKKTVEIIGSKGYKISNIDTTLSLQKPKISPHVEKMRTVLAQVMDIDIDDISIKATTTEHLGFEGREEGISAYATVLITKD